MYSTFFVTTTYVLFGITLILVPVNLIASMIIVTSKTMKNSLNDVISSNYRMLYFTIARKFRLEAGWCYVFRPFKFKYFYSVLTEILFKNKLHRFSLNVPIFNGLVLLLCVIGSYF